LDDLDEGPFYEIWRSFGKEVLRKNNLKGGVNCFEKAIFSIPGGSNFIWKDVWKPNPCIDGKILNLYIKHVLSHYGLLEEKKRNENDPIRILFS
jgi:EGF domain-specific O-GlcNAc transferase